MSPTHPLPSELIVHLPDGRQWPCILRITKRALRVRLRVNEQGLARLVMPPHRSLTQARVEKILVDMAPWLQDTLDNLGLDAPPVPLGQGPEAVRACLPETIPVPVLGGYWQVQWRKEADQPPQLYCLPPPVQTPDVLPCKGVLQLHGDISDPAMACALLHEWLRAEARAYLPTEAAALAHALNLPLAEVRIRTPRRRWGSCSSRGRLSFNSRLLLLPEALVRHVLLHEVCHLRYMDHSPYYREFLQYYAPDWKEKEKQLSMAWRALPLWAVL